MPLKGGKHSILHDDPIELAEKTSTREQWSIEYEDAARMFRVHSHNGKIAQTLGRCVNGKYYISLEEAVFLLEQERVSHCSPPPKVILDKALAEGISSDSILKACHLIWIALFHAMHHSVPALTTGYSL